MAIVNERQYAAKPVQVDPKTGKPLTAAQAAAAPQRSASPSLESSADANGGFFGSFFASKSNKMAAMEPPPPSLKASGTLSERETVEVEVISKSPTKCIPGTITDEI
jgi:hypothetical protein